MIEELITEDILSAKLSSETGCITDADLKYILQNQYGTIEEEDDGTIRILTYDNIDEIQYRNRYDITINKDIALTSGLSPTPNVVETGGTGRRLEYSSE